MLLCLYTRAFIYFPQTQLSGKNRDYARSGKNRDYARSGKNRDYASSGKNRDYASSGKNREFQRIRQEDRVCRNYVGNVN